MTGVVHLRTTGSRVTANRLWTAAIGARGVSRRPCGCEILRRWLSTAYVDPTRARLPEVPARAPGPRNETDEAECTRAEGSGDKFALPTPTDVIPMLACPGAGRGARDPSRRDFEPPKCTPGSLPARSQRTGQDEK